jgi:hypothetical protein
MMEIIGDNIIRHFTTRKIGEGLTDADSLPTGTVYKNGTATGITVTVNKISTGNYKASFTAAAGSGADQFVIGDDWALYLVATVDSVADAGVISQGTFDNKRVGALNDIAAGAAMTLTAAYDAAKTAAAAGAEMDLVDAPNSTAITAIQSGLSTFDASSDEVDIGAVKGVAVSGVDDFKADVSGLSTLSLTSEVDATGSKITLGDALKYIASFASGKSSRSGDAYTFYAKDGTTELFTLTITADTRTPS